MSDSECNEGTESLNRTVTILYVSIQITIAVFISIIGAIHVKQCKDQEKKELDLDKTITVTTGCYMLLFLCLFCEI